MIDISKIDFSELDQPEILSFLFYPRPDTGGTLDPGNRRDFSIPVDRDIHVGARLHVSGKKNPTILFFHGNGEIVSDYDDVGFLYSSLNLNFLPVDYRGYGQSSGRPTITSMMKDCHIVLEYIGNWLNENRYMGSIVVMGRSMGSAPALELAAHYPDRIDGLIVESGFASLEGLYERIGISTRIPEEKKRGLSNVDKITRFNKPTLIIHAEYDNIIPFSAGESLYLSSGSAEKTFLKVPGADHNDIFYIGGNTYLKAIVALCDKVRRKSQK